MVRATLATVALLIGLISPARADDEATIKQIESALKELNDAFETGHPEPIKKLMTADHVAVTPWAGSQTRDEQVGSLKDLKLSAYKPGKMTITITGPGSALVAYPLVMTGTFRGKPVPAENFAAAVWVLRDGAWKELYYHETPAPAAK